MSDKPAPCCGCCERLAVAFEHYLRGVGPILQRAAWADDAEEIGRLTGEAIAISKGEGNG